MTPLAWTHLLVLGWVLGGLAVLGGRYMHALFLGQETPLQRWLGPVERLLYRLAGIQPQEGLDALGYTQVLLVWGACNVLATYALLRLQGCWSSLPGQTPLQALNFAVSLATNTDWQACPPETSLGQGVQMLALTVQGFVSAATGVVVAVALVRGFAAHQTRCLGNPWVDLVRAVLYLLLPGCVWAALLLMLTGVPQNLAAPTRVYTLEGRVQELVQGPVASQEAIKLLGTNGAGPFTASSAHPFENPTPLSNALAILAMLALPASLTRFFGLGVGDTRQGWVLFAVMMALLGVGFVTCQMAETRAHPWMARLGVDAVHRAEEGGGNLEGKEVRFGVLGTTLFATVTTATATGATNAAHDSLTPYAQLVLLVNLVLGEVIFGGAGTGLAGMLVFAVLAVFLAGLMVGRTPEYLGKKIEHREVQLAMLAVLAMCASILLGTATAVYGGPSCPTESAAAGHAPLGPHAFTQLLYAYASTTGNNGSAMAGLDATTPFFQLSTAAAMMAGRYLMIVPVLALAGSLASKKYLTPGPGTLPTGGGLFALLLVVVLVLVGALTFLPALALGPLAEALQLQRGIAW